MSSVGAVAAPPTNLNLATEFLDRNIHEGRGERIALHGPAGAWTYAEVAELTNRAGNLLRELGVRKGDRVLLALSDSVEFVATWYAAQKIGAVTAEVYTFLQPKDYAYYLGYTAAPVVLVDNLTLEPMRAARALTGTMPMVLAVGAPAALLRNDERSFDALISGQSAELVAEPASSDDVAIWKFTTGSTGQPKACVHAARSPWVSHHGYALGVLGMRSDDIVLPVPKLFFGYARDLTALFPFGVGAAGVVYPERTSAGVLFELIARHRPTILVNVPTMMLAMIEHPDAAAQDLSCLRICTSAGEALPEPLHRRWLETFGVEVLDGIGSSEAYHIYISNRPGGAVPGTIGEPVPGYGVRVVDEAGGDLGAGAIGRLWIRGGSAALRYEGHPESSRRTFAGDLVMSGDLGERREDGRFRYHGRADDLLKIGGIWVAPAEIERCVADHPDVIECAVVGTEHGGLTRARAYVVTRPGAALTADDVRQHVRDRLAPHKRPRDVVFVPELPRTGSGKIDRRQLHSMAEAGQ